MGLLIETLRTAAPPASWIDRWFKLMDADPWGLWNEPAVLGAAGPEAQARYAERACQDWHKWRQRPRKTTSRRSSSFLTSDDDLERDLLRRRYLEVLARQDDPRALLDAMIEAWRPPQNTAMSWHFARPGTGIGKRCNGRSQPPGSTPRRTLRGCVIALL